VDVVWGPALGMLARLGNGHPCCGPPLQLLGGQAAACVENTWPARPPHVCSLHMLIPLAATHPLVEALAAVPVKTWRADQNLGPKNTTAGTRCTCLTLSGQAVCVICHAAAGCGVRVQLQPAPACCFPIWPAQAHGLASWHRCWVMPTPLAGNSLDQQIAPPPQPCACFSNHGHCMLAHHTLASSVVA